MKRWLPIFAAACALALAVPSFARSDEWKKVEDAVERGLPRTAIEALEPIIDRALEEGAYDEAAKAIARKIVLEGTIEGNLPEERIVRMDAALPAAPEKVRPILHTLLAHWYWHYFQQNRWRFTQRTMTGEPPGEDFRAWDLARLFAEIDLRFMKALEAEEFLKSTPVGDWDALLEKGTMPDRYRPTLYDFIAQEALAFYTAGEQAGARPRDDFEIAAASPIFDGVEEFLVWELPEETGDSSKAKAIRLYQKLLRFHRDDAERAAFADVDLARLVFGKNAAVGDERAGRFIAAVKSFTENRANREIAAMGLFEWARALQQEEDFAQAHAVARRAVSNYPNSPGAQRANDLILQIEEKSARISTERVWNDPWPEIQVEYKNVDRVYFRAVAHDWEDLLKEGPLPDRLSRETRDTLLDKPVAAHWDRELPRTADFKERSEYVGVVKTLDPGFYAIIASHDPEFRREDNQVSVATIWVSDLALVVRPRAGHLEGLVVNARSGEPVEGAKVDLWELHHQEPRVRPRPPLTTDARGFFSRKWESPRTRFVLRASHRGQQVASATDNFYSHATDPRAREHSVLFTDRAIYRPGQTIQYKGILLRADQANDNYEVIGWRRATVVFRDANGQEIGRQERQSNGYGSFAGSFTAPRDRLTGQMRIEVLRPEGVAYLRVEEYKRPRFLVTLDPPAEAPRLNDAVTIAGKAAAYTGAPVDGAEVRYRVVRETRWPWWSRGHRHSARSGSQEIAHGTVRTEADGSFQIEFIAQPDLSISEEDDPTFVYRVHADVTDNAGETRSAERRVSAGYTALQAELTTRSWQTVEAPVEIEVLTRSLDGEAEPAEGLVKIYSLEQPERVHRPKLRYDWERYRRWGSAEEDPSNPESWPLAGVVAERAFSTAEDGRSALSFPLSSGVYRAVVESKDRFGKNVTGHLQMHVLDPAENEFRVRVPHFFTAEKQSLEPGETFTALWGTGYNFGRAFVEIENRQEMIESFWTDPLSTQSLVEFDVTEEMRGGFTVHVTYVRENRAYTESVRVEVPWTNKELDVRWEHFTSKLEPNQRETWTAVITGPDAEPAVAEMAATLYDASLDSFVNHVWIQRLPHFYHDRSTGSPRFANHRLRFDVYLQDWGHHPRAVVTYRSFPYNVAGFFGRFEMPREAARGSVAMRAPPAPMAPKPAALDGRFSDSNYAGAPDLVMSGYGPGDATIPDLAAVAARRNLQETAFFFPQLTSDKDGVVRVSFTMPEALTEWRFMGFAHDEQMRSGFIEGKAVTSKELMVQPNAPRFVREGDIIEFSVKITNQSDAPQQGNVRLTFTDAMTEKPADEALENLSPEQPFSIPARESRSYAWRLKVPDGLAVLTYRAVAASASVSDGEEGYLPVLSRRVLVREALPLPIRGPDEKEFVFEKLLRSGDSETLEHQGLTVQMVSNPAWYVVLALPYLMEFPHECTEQTFNRFYANALARHIAASNPQIRRTFDLWKNTPALDSPLEKNDELKSVVLLETPWVRQAQSESQARRNVGVLFDENRLNYEIGQTLRKLTEAQMSDGAWSWFPGGPPNDFITLYITTGFGRIRHLGVEVPLDAPLRALNRLDAWIDRTYRELPIVDKNNLTPAIALYLYGRSFFLEDRPVASEHREAVDYFLGQAREYWLRLNHRQSQGHLALALRRFGDETTPAAIVDSLRERAVRDEEMGMFWRDREFSWWWYRAPIETQALMIEAFAEVANDDEAVEECKVWLLKQKQTRDWKTTKATADATYALLLRGANLLASDKLVEVSLGRGEDARDLTPDRSAGAVEAGTGLYEARFSGPEVTPELGYATVRKVDEGVAWGSVHWQYLEDISKITPHDATPLKLRKQIFTKRATALGPVLEPVNGSVEVGDELVVRIELRGDRDMEYLHLKDQRGSGLEPLNVLSRYRYQDGLAYYESTRDTASHFFIDYLPKGVYVFEYSTRVFHRGEYETGIAEIQSMYAPEFSSHSESIPLKVR